MFRRRGALTIDAENSLGETEEFEVDSHADTCPVCRTAATPTLLGAYAIGDGNHVAVVEIVYRCPRNECRAVYVSVFKRPWNSMSGYSGRFSLSHSEPSSPEKPDVPEAVATLSERFVDVYSQACAAEQYGLSEVAGPGYRKAFEILIKDFITVHRAKTEDEGEGVKCNPRLGALVDEYFGKTKLSDVLHRVAWLGNDETHYARRWEDKDLRDLHALLKIAINMIENDLLASTYIEEMP
jgi:hypothetical protein